MNMSEEILLLSTEKMANPWEEISLSDYENHMKLADMSVLIRKPLRYYRIIELHGILQKEIIKKGLCLWQKAKILNGKNRGVMII